VGKRVDGSCVGKRVRKRVRKRVDGSYVGKRVGKRVW
jgi:hypothetical protein